MFKPLNPPPSDYDALNTGLGTEKGDSAKTMMEKINAGFAHVYSLFNGDPNVRLPDAVTAPASDMVAAFEARIAALEAKAAPIASDVKADIEALIGRLAHMENVMTAPPVSGEVSVEVVAKSEFMALQDRFDNLAEKMEVFFGLKKK